MDISLQLSKNSRVPLYQQIYRQLRSFILNGSLPTGARLPSTRRLAASHAVARVTVLQAYEQLEAEGFVEGRAGAGTYVAHDLPINGRFSRTPPDPFQPTLSPWANRLRQTLPPPKPTPQPIDLSFGSSTSAHFPYDIWRRITARLSTDDALLTGHSAAAGFLPLRQAIADYLTHSRGVNCQPEQIVIVSGARQALDILARLLLAVGDELLVESPGDWVGYELLRAHGARLHPLPVDTCGLPASQIPAHCRAKLAFVTPSHQFPRGGAMPLAQRLALLDWARRQQALIIEADNEGELRYDGRPLAALQGLDREERVIYLGTLSKLLFPALRLGYVVLPTTLVAPFLHAKGMIDPAAPLLTQAAVAEFITEGHFDAHLRQLRRVYQERWTLLTQLLDTQLGDRVCFSRAAAGQHLLVYLPPTVDEAELVRQTAVSGITLTPATPYHLHQPAPPAILLNFANATAAELETAVGGLTAVFHKLAG